MGQNDGVVSRHRRRFPPWLIGLILAIILFVAALVIADALGYGDDPVVEPGSASTVTVL